MRLSRSVKSVWQRQFLNRAVLKCHLMTNWKKFVFSLTISSWIKIAQQMSDCAFGVTWSLTRTRAVLNCSSRFSCRTYSDAFPELAKLAGIIIVSPIGTAGVERSFSVMNRLCNKLRQRLTPQHLSQLLLISQGGPEHITRQELTEIVYMWYNQGACRIQLPPRL